MVEFSEFTNFSVKEGLTNLIDSQTLLIGIIALIIFLGSFFIFSRKMKTEEGKTKTKKVFIISLVITAVLMVIIYSQLNLLSILNINFINNPITLLIIAAVLIIILLKKTSFATTLAISGIALIALSLTSIIYEKGIITITGIVLLIVSLWLWRRKSSKANEQNS